MVRSWKFHQQTRYLFEKGVSNCRLYQKILFFLFLSSIEPYRLKNVNLKFWFANVFWDLWELLWGLKILNFGFYSTIKNQKQNNYFLNLVFKFLFLVKFLINIDIIIYLLWFLKLYENVKYDLNRISLGQLKSQVHIRNLFTIYCNSIFKHFKIP